MDRTSHLARSLTVHMRIERDLARLTEPFDLIVIGGGITGVCVAREAAGRGVRTLLIEKDDFGGGTSAATSKYIHGGIRYLETYEFRVVRESLRERRILALAAPHLVRQTRFLMPAWSWSKPSAPVLGAGVAVYDLLSFDRNRNAPDSLKVPHPRWVRKQALLKAVPWLDPDGLHGAFAYTDTFNLHPERLLLAFLKSAVQAGAVALNHVQARGFVTAPIGGDEIAVLGVEVQDLLTDDRYTVKARTVVNAAGPWIDVVLRDLGRPVGVSVRRSKGVHLLTRPLGGDDTVFARARSGKHVIVSPWQGYSFIGPTDTGDRGRARRCTSRARRRPPAPRHRELDARPGRRAAGRGRRRGHDGRHPPAHRRGGCRQLQHEPPSRALRPRPDRGGQPVVDRRGQVDDGSGDRRGDGRGTPALAGVAGRGRAQVRLHLALPPEGRSHGRKTPRVTCRKPLARDRAWPSCPR